MSLKKTSNKKNTRTTKKPHFIYRLWTFIVATLCFGPLALPLLWKNPNYTRRNKMLGTAAVLVFTVAISVLFIKILDPMLEPYRQILGQ